MKDQVLMSESGELCVGTPLFNFQFEYLDDDTRNKYKLLLIQGKLEPIAYVLDIGKAAQVVGAAFVKNCLLNLGDL